MQLFITHQENVLTSAGKLVDTVWGPRVVVAFVQVCECWSLQCWSKCRINNEHFLANSKTNYNVTLLCYKLTSLTFQLQPSTYLCLYEIPQACSLNLCFLLLIFPWIHSILCPVSFFHLYWCSCTFLSHFLQNVFNDWRFSPPRYSTSRDRSRDHHLSIQAALQSESSVACLLAFIVPQHLEILLKYLALELAPLNTRRNWIKF